ncbi:MAG: DUF3685 domain-containing protein [Leptolyngbyaceae cyanobacterium MO_188.B28]|nr:DUF3685 domain-containing protein [Leptolyngbyaceae cyanobacterium MO_188.B28]
MNQRPLQLMLVDDDPVFRLGLRIWLEPFADLQVAAEAETGSDALQILQRRLEEPSNDDVGKTSGDSVETEDASTTGLDLVILDLGLGEGDSTQIPGLRLCQQIRTQFPHLPILVLSAHSEPVLQVAAQQAGATGYGLRGMPVRTLAHLIRQVALGRGRQPISGADSAETAKATVQPDFFSALRINLRLSGVQQIEDTLAEVLAELQSSDISPLYRMVLEGRHRELKAARGLLNRLLATPQFLDGAVANGKIGKPIAGAGKTDAGTARRSELILQRSDPLRKTGAPARSLAKSSSALPTSFGALQTHLFESIFAKLQTSLDSNPLTPLEIDILRPEKKRELLYLTLRKLEDVLDDLRNARIQPGQLPEKCPELLRDLWQAITIDFFGKYYTLQVDDLEQALVKQLLEDAEIVQLEILNTIPLAPDLFAYLLFEESLMVDGTPYLARTPEAIAQAQKLLENLLIQVANGVIQPLLNQFADVESIKKNFYHRRLMSTREIERFRNDLSWRYRWNSFVTEPTAIFESQYRLFVFTEQGIQAVPIYAPRRQEMEQLGGIQYAVTLALETRDAIAPRLRVAISLIGSGLVYILTEFVGRGIGLIGRGILQGIGSAWQDRRFKREGRD